MKMKMKMRHYQAELNIWLSKQHSVSLAKVIFFFILILLYFKNIDVAWADNGQLLDVNAEFADFRANRLPDMEVPEPEPEIFIPDIPVLEQPLIPDEVRRSILFERIGLQAYVFEMELDTVVELVYRQAEIERHIEAGLISDGIPIYSYWRNLNRLRSVLFSPHGYPLSQATLTRHLQEIAQNGTRQSIPYRRVYRAIRNLDLFFDLPHTFWD